MRDKAAFRDPALGPPKEVHLAQGTMRYYEAGAGPTIVFVHGMLVNANLWRKVFPLLRRDFQLVAFDLPLGSHLLPMPPEADLGERGLVNLIADAIEALDLENVTLVGMDTGGALCQFVVTQRSERIGRLVLCSCDYRNNFPPLVFSHLKLLPYVKPIVPLLFAPFRLRVVRRLPNGYGWLSKRPVDRRVEDSWALPTMDDRRIRSDLAKTVRVFNKRRLNECAEQLRAFKGPALIAWSADDKVFPRDHARGLAEDLANARIEWIEDSGTLSMEDQPERLAEAITGFVRETQSVAA